MKSILLVAASASFALALCGGVAQAATQVIGVSPTTTGNQPETGLDLGIDFTVAKDVKVYGLGAFTNGSSSIPVSLYSSGGALLASATISGSPAAGSDYVFSGLSSALLLTPGTYQIEATYDSSSNKDYNPYEPGGTSSITFDTLGGALSLAGDYYNYPGVGGMATTPDALSTGGYGAGTFEASAVPEPATWAIMLAGLIGLGAILRVGGRRKNAGLIATS